MGASFGTPPTTNDSVNNGSTFQFSTTCHSDNSLPDTKVYCPLNASSNCSSGFIAENGIFVDPCYGTSKHYDGWFVCAAATDAGGSAPYYCSRQNLTFTGSDPCTTPSDGGAAKCTGTCMTHFADCNANLQSDGCEADLLIDPNNCGTCNNVCTGSTPACVAGTCVE